MPLWHGWVLVCALSVPLVSPLGVIVLSKDPVCAGEEPVWLRFGRSCALSGILRAVSQHFFVPSKVLLDAAGALGSVPACALGAPARFWLLFGTLVVAAFGCSLVTLSLLCDSSPGRYPQSLDALHDGSRRTALCSGEGAPGRALSRWASLGALGPPKETL